MATQLSDCCKAPIDTYPKLPRPECHRCSFCDRVIGSPLNKTHTDVEGVVEELALQIEILDDEGFPGDIYKERRRIISKTLQSQADQYEKEKREIVKALLEDKNKIVNIVGKVLAEKYGVDLSE